MLIWGRTTRSTRVSEGVFVCPFEGTQQGYWLLSVRRWFTVFWFPVIPLRRGDDIVRCESCGRGFHDRVLLMGVQDPTAHPGVEMPVPRRFTPSMLVLPLLLVAVGNALWQTRGTTNVSLVAAGDCFVLTEAEEITRLDTPACSATHDSQIVALVEVPSSGSYPEAESSYWDSVYDLCWERAQVGLVRWEALPDDAYVSFFTPTPAGWAAGDRESLCYISSESGLEGSFLP